MSYKSFLILACSLLLGTFSFAQDAKVLDRIVAVIGEEVILESDIENQYNYLLINGEKDDGNLRCQVLDQLIVSKLLLNKARQDSIDVGDAQVEAELEQRMAFILSKIERSEFENIYGRSIAQFREDIKEDIRNELLTQTQRNLLLQEADVTPKEVRKFFSSIPIDTLGLLPAEVMLNHIVIKPPYSKESEESVISLLSDLRAQALNGADFAGLATKNTDEPGGRQGGGDLGWFGRGMMVPAFEEKVYSMRVGEVSEPFQTQFGYHIVKLVERRGERVQARHILKYLSQSSNGDSLAIDSLNKVMKLVDIDSLTFEQAAIRFSQDRGSKHCGGCISNPQTGELRIPMDALDPDMYFKIDEMEQGEISKPMELVQPDGTRSFHVIYLRSKIPPHKPNLKDDYQKVSNAALQAKQAENFDKWLATAKKNIYIDIKPTECQNALKNWVENAEIQDGRRSR